MSHLGCRCAAQRTCVPCRWATKAPTCRTAQQQSICAGQGCGIARLTVCRMSQYHGTSVTPAAPWKAQGGGRTQAPPHRRTPVALPWCVAGFLWKAHRCMARNSRSRSGAVSALHDKFTLDACCTALRCLVCAGVAPRHSHGRPLRSCCCCCYERQTMILVLHARLLATDASPCASCTHCSVLFFSEGVP